MNTIDIDALLKPLPGATPAGRDVTDGKNFELFKEARRGEEDLNQGDWTHDLKVADWAKVIELATAILTKEGKDLQVAVWLTEALLRRHGFAGLADGLALLVGLHELYWETFYPLKEGGELDFRTGRLESLNKLLPYAIWTVPLIQPPGGAPFSYWHYKQSQEVENLRRAAQNDAEKRRALAEALEDGKLEGEKFDKAVAATPLAACTATLQTLARCRTAHERLEEVLANTYGEDAPSLRLVREAIEECRTLMESIVRKKGGGGGVQGGKVAMPQDALPAQRIDPAGTGNGMPADRAEALRRLQEVAEFFRRTEPHSPVAYLLQRATRWGHMPLDEWLQEVIKNEGVLGEVRETLGIKSESITTQE